MTLDIKITTGTDTIFNSPVENSPSFINLITCPLKPLLLLSPKMSSNKPIKDMNHIEIAKTNHFAFEL